jgi:hypothetical protein
MNVPPLRIITGGQTGADRAAMDAALDAGVDCGGWCPPGRLAEDGAVPDRYPVTPLPADAPHAADPYEARTVRNVLDSDGTVILSFGPPAGGSGVARHAAIAIGRPLLVIDAGLTAPDEAAQQIVQFAQAHRLRSLHVAGPRASEQPRIGDYVHAALASALRRLA